MSILSNNQQFNRGILLIKLAKEWSSTLPAISEGTCAGCGDKNKQLVKVTTPRFKNIACCTICLMREIYLMIEGPSSTTFDESIAEAYGIPLSQTVTVNLLDAQEDQIECGVVIAAPTSPAAISFLDEED